MNFNLGPIIKFTPTSASFPFDRKQVSLPNKVRVQLECQSTEAPSLFNAVFPRGPISLSTPHAEVWVQGRQVLIRDRGSMYGTYVNGIRIQQQTLLESGDIITLGQQISRSSAPQNTSDSQLNPIEASITIVGA